MMKRMLIAVAMAFFGVGVAAAQQDTISARIALMKANAKSMYGGLNQMVKETKPYDQAVVDTALAQLEEAVGKLGSLYPDSTKGLKSPVDDYSASAKIWDNKADFESHISKLTKIVADSKSKINSLDALKAAYPTLNGGCIGCHEVYRLKNG